MLGGLGVRVNGSIHFGAHGRVLLGLVWRLQGGLMLGLVEENCQSCIKGLVLGLLGVLVLGLLVEQCQGYR